MGTTPETAEAKVAYVKKADGTMYRVGTSGPTGPTGPKGDTGNTGPAGAKGDTGAASTVPGPTGPKGDTGTAGAAGAAGSPGQGVPTGGTSGQVLSKTSATDYATAWADPSGGTTILTGTAAPTDSVGATGDYYLDTDSNLLYGPKGPPPPPVTAKSFFQSPLTWGVSSETLGFNWALGLNFTVAVAGKVTGLRFYRYNSSGPSGHTLNLWSEAGGGTLLGTVTTTGETPGQWSTAYFGAPVYVAAGAKLRTQFNATSGEAYGRATGLAVPVTNGDLTMTGGCQGNGSVASYPSSSVGTQAFVDLLFEADDLAVPPRWPVALSGGATELYAQTTAPTGTGTLLWVDVDDTSLEGGGGGGYTRTTSTVTTASLAADASQSGTVTLANGYRILNIATSRPARVRLYTTTGKRDADAARPIGTDPTGDHGMVMEAVTSASLLSINATPAIDGYDGKVTPDGVIGYHITNKDTATGTVAATFTWLRTE